MKKLLLALLLCLAAKGSTPFAARGDEIHRELPVVRKNLDRALSDLKNADSLESYIKVFDALSQVIALDSKSRTAFAARGEVVRRALRLQDSILSEDETTRKEILDVDAALKDFDKAVALGPKKDDLMALITYGRGRIFLGHKKDARRALAAFNQSIAARKDFGPAYLGRALASGSLENPNLKSVFNDYDQALKFGFEVAGLGFDEDVTYKNYFQNQSLSMAHHGRGLLLVLQGENEAALADLDAAITASMLNTAAIFDRAKLHSQMNAPQKSIVDFSTLILWRPNDAELYRLRAAQYEKLGGKEKAAADLARVAEISIGKGSTPFTNTATNKVETSLQAQQRGDDLMAAGKTLDAIQAYSSALEIDPKNIAALSSRGWALARARVYSRAAADFDAALKLRPNDAELLIARGQMNGRAGQTENAIEDLKRASELAPGNIAAWEQLGVIYQANGNYADAEINFVKSTEIITADPTAQGVSTSVAFARLLVVRAVQGSDLNWFEEARKFWGQHLTAAMQICAIELKKHPDSVAMKKLEDGLQFQFNPF